MTSRELGMVGIWFVMGASFCRLNPDTCGKEGHHMLLVATSTTSTRILLFLLLPCQATLPADVNLFTSFVYYDPAATGWQTVKQEAEPRSLGRWAENIDRR